MARARAFAKLSQRAGAMTFHALRFNLETRAYALHRLSVNQANLQKQSALESTPARAFERRKRKFETMTKAQTTDLISAEAEELTTMRQKTRTAFQIDLLMNIIHLLFVTLEVYADWGIELANEQLTIVYEVWACNLASFVGNPNIYPMVKEVIYRMYAIVFRGKINDFVLGRRFGKSFCVMLAMSSMLAVCPVFTCCVLNLAGHAAQTNMSYVVNFIKKLETDPKKRIRCKFQKVEKNQKLYVVSHYQTLRLEMEDTAHAASYLQVLKHNTFESFPNMSANDGEVRGFFLLTAPFFILLVPCSRARPHTHTHTHARASARSILSTSTAWRTKEITADTLV